MPPTNTCVRKLLNRPRFKKWLDAQPDDRSLKVTTDDYNESCVIARYINDECGEVVNVGTRYVRPQSGGEAIRMPDTISVIVSAFDCMPGRYGDLTIGEFRKQLDEKHII